MPGEELELDLRLKLMADRARRPAQRRQVVAAPADLERKAEGGRLPVHTLAPVLGTVDSPSGRQLTVADVPG